MGNNKEYIDLFKKELQASGVSEKTCRRHIMNAELFIDDYLDEREELSMEDGCSKIDDFLGFFFIRKCMWSTPSAIKSTAASLKKFYKCMLSNGKITKDAYEYLCETIKWNMEDWQETCAQYNNPNMDNPFKYFF